MPETPQRVYWDSCVFLSYVNGNPDRLPDIDALFLHAGRGDLEIVTSTLSIAEVAFGATEQLGRALDPATEAKIDGLWVPGGRVVLVEFYALIAAQARQLMRDSITRDWSLKAMDACHLATAQRMGVASFHTYDDKLWKYGPVVGFSVEAPTAAQREMFGGS